ncbi:MAG: LysM peptidoglycan-binding domain-containing protein [Ardenticatenaceae bacterium]|nr:LysM peptidoglycan-binding domain-containing protein [Ardenticatenaceae bacterium]
MSVENLLTFVPLAIGISWLFYLIFKANLAVQPLAKIISYFLGVVIIALTVGWLIDNVLPLWFNDRIQNTRASVEWQQFVGTSTDLIDDSFSADGTTQSIVPQPTTQPIIQAPIQADPQVQPDLQAPSGVLLQPTTHVVQAGETLSYISRIYGVPLDQLRQVNNLQYSDLIFVGQELIIPARPADAGDPK